MFRDAGCLFRNGARQEEQEFLPTMARHQVGRTRGCPAGVSKGPQGNITHGMAVPVVELLEVVQIRMIKEPYMGWPLNLRTVSCTRSAKAERFNNPVRPSWLALIRSSAVTCSMLRAAMLKETTTSSVMVKRVVMPVPKNV